MIFNLAIFKYVEPIFTNFANFNFHQIFSLYIEFHIFYFFIHHTFNLIRFLSLSYFYFSPFFHPRSGGGEPGWWSCRLIKGGPGACRDLLYVTYMTIVRNITQPMFVTPKWWFFVPNLHTNYNGDLVQISPKWKNCTKSQ